MKVPTALLLITLLAGAAGPAAASMARCVVKTADARYEISLATLSVEIPSCASYAFAGVPDDIQSKARTGGLFRRGIGTYRFPANRDGIKRLRSGDIDFGKVMQIQFAHAPATVLAYDWREYAYRTLGASPR